MTKLIIGHQTFIKSAEIRFCAIYGEEKNYLVDHLAHESSYPNLPYSFKKNTYPCDYMMMGFAVAFSSGNVKTGFFPYFPKIE